MIVWFEWDAEFYREAMTELFFEILKTVYKILQIRVAMLA